MKTFLFHGPSGSGKDTQIEKLLEKYPFERIATGEMFRKLYEEKDPDGVTAQKEWGVGKWVDSELTYKLLNKWVEKFDKKKDWIFVSVVREPEQIALLDELLKKQGRTLDKVIHFMLSEESAIERMATRTICPKCQAAYHPTFKKEKVPGICDICGTKLIHREDDTPEKIRSRLSEYNRTIKSFMDEYQKRGILVEIDASPSVEQIHTQVVKELDLK